MSSALGVFAVVGDGGLLIMSRNMPLHNFALTRIQSFSMQWETSKVTNQRSSPGNVVDVFNLADATGQPQPELDLGREPSQLAVLYATMKIRSAHHNQPVGSINHTSWVIPDQGTPPLLSLDAEEWKKVVHQPVQTEELNVPWFKKSGPDEWLELAVNNFDDKGHPFHPGKQIPEDVFQVREAKSQSKARLRVLRCRESHGQRPLQRLQPLRPHDGRV